MRAPRLDPALPLRPVQVQTALMWAAPEWAPDPQPCSAVRSLLQQTPLPAATPIPSYAPLRGTPRRREPRSRPREVRLIPGRELTRLLARRRIDVCHALEESSPLFRVEDYFEPVVPQLFPSILSGR